MKTINFSLLRGFLLAPMVIAAASSSFAGATLDRIKQTGVINIGFRESGLPFSYKNSETGAPLGYGIEVCAALADAIKQEIRLKAVELKYVPVAGAARIAAVAEGKIDLECANTTNTKARREQVAFAMPYYYAAARLLVKDGSGIGKIEDLAGKTLVVTKGSTGSLIAEARRGKGLATMKVVVVETSAEGAAAVDGGTADAFMTDDILLHGFKAQAKNPMAVVGPSMSVEPLAVMYSKTDPELETLITKEMMHMYTSGKMKTIYKKWFQSSLPQRNYNLNVSPNALLSDMFSRPSGFIVDWVML
ncbi:amino acid ABC transporter substrate-binding protein [Rhodoferax aquaticus]|uniref:Amino acid ABC transporter substrate-binding protein n=1 Tax=Rhodoferax aquaticus TaxID=2527691 RepID=A0A515EKZ9_9BURK|nr:amino acid ABC transporter substrate-binding protein [Rhodoferax aquaticus]QDL53337.1 amino acid ABC transporter substrate-binding protein [Rhodoferax aquaticus]